MPLYNGVTGIIHSREMILSRPDVNWEIGCRSEDTVQHSFSGFTYGCFSDAIKLKIIQLRESNDWTLIVVAGKLEIYIDVWSPQRMTNFFFAPCPQMGGAHRTRATPRRLDLK